VGVLLDLEDLISRHVAVREVAVVGIADPQWGERPFACWWSAKAMHRCPGTQGTPQAVRGTGAHEQVGDPEPDRLVTEIPKTSVGKLDKRIRVDITEWQANNSTFLSTL
jgi:fatty-acyl-CoA synthase